MTSACACFGRVDAHAHARKCSDVILRDDLAGFIECDVMRSIKEAWEGINAAFAREREFTDG
jgi:hypothetical protein